VFEKGNGELVMANAIEYIERAARNVDPDSDAFVELRRQYNQELARCWASGPLDWREALDHDKRRDYPARFKPFQLPSAGTKAWQQQALRFGVDPVLIAEAPARVELSRAADEPIKRNRQEYSFDSALFLACRQPYMRKRGDVDKFGNDYEAERMTDLVVERVRALHRLAVKTGFLVAPACEQTEVAA
jgi:hypothetical protein